VAHPDGPQPVAVGVALPPVNEIGEWLADAAAFEAAGARALWISVAEESDLDPLVLTAALAIVTVRSLLVVAVPNAEPRALATLVRLSRGRLRVAAHDAADGIPAGVGVFRPVRDESGTYEEPQPGGQSDRWVTVAAPTSRAAWRETLLSATELGCRGLLVPADPRLLDILRNPDDDGDRRDLHLSVG
jgi:hypothetical protein